MIDLARGAAGRIPGVRGAADRVRSVRALAETGVLAPLRPDKAARAALAVRRHGKLGAVSELNALRWGDAVALVDDLGSLTFREVDERANALANAWLARGVRPGAGVAILCRNHRGILDAKYAAAKIGGSAIFLNTSFAEPQVNDVAEREGTDVLVYDEEFGPVVERARMRCEPFLGWAESASGLPDPLLEDLVSSGARTPPPAPGVDPRIVMLTSGTTGTPKGAPRAETPGLVTAGGLLERFPFRTREVTMVPAPMFHAWGFAHVELGLILGCRVVVQRRFDPEDTLRAISEHRATALMPVPVMLARILELGDEVLDRYDTSSLRIIGCGGSAISPEIVTRAMDRFGDILYNLYGSTEVSAATIATPRDLRLAPDTAGKPVIGCEVRLYDERGRRVEGVGAVGRIFVGGDFRFDGYTGGGTKEVIDGLMSTGDTGRFDADGRLYVVGRDDEMIVSGGENLFPKEVEDAIAAHDDVIEAACVGVDDDEFGKRLAAFVVVREGAELTAEDVRSHVKANLARFKVPRDVTFIDALPRNPTGKVLKRSLVPPDVPSGASS